MKRKQIYIDNNDFDMPSKTVGMEEGLMVLNEAAGLWKDRDFDTQEYVRFLRENRQDYKAFSLKSIQYL